MQDYANDSQLKYAKTWFSGPLDFVCFQLPETKERVSLSWHLTEKEKLFLKEASWNDDNGKALKQLMELLPPGNNNPTVAN